MSGNPMPWIVLASVVLASLYLKGYLKFPPAPSAVVNLPGPAVQSPSQGQSTINIDDLAKLGSYTLGLAFAKAVRAEAESTVAGQIARDAAETIHARFSSPFSMPGPAGQDPNQTGVKPSA